MNFWFVIGTAAELIKVYPLIDEAARRGLSWHIILTGQSSTNFWNQARDFSLPESKIIEISRSGKDLKNSLMAMRWFFKAVLINSFRLRTIIRDKSGLELGQKDYFIVHGDTLSTLVGAIYGTLYRLKIVHVEAGMRSHNWKSPFPEELSRRIVSQLAKYHMAPDENAKKNLLNEGISQNVVVTGGNTVVDAIQLAMSTPLKSSYVLVNIHRFENLNSSKRWDSIMKLLFEVAKKNQIIFVMMPNTEEKINLDKKLKEKLIQSDIKLIARLPFKEFVNLLEGAEFVLSDGGSNQQECHYIGKPCLILRDLTESIEGIGGACVISKFDPTIIENFLKNYKQFARPLAFPLKRPTDIIFENLL